MTEIPKSAYEKAIDQIEWHRKRVDSLRPALDLLDEIANEWGDGADARFSTISLTADLDITGPDIRAVTPALRQIRAAGHRLRYRREYGDSGSVVWYFSDGVELHFYLVKEGAKCRFEIVDTKTEERPVYKIVCDDGEEVGDFTEELEAV